MLARTDVERPIMRYYVKDSRLPFGEDRCREFKGHRRLTQEEIPLRFNRTCRSVSRNINGFLNTGLGGRVYLGVLDDGTAMGLLLSDAQGISIPRYIVEISILPFTRDPTLSTMTLQLHPIFENEEGKCFFRGSTSLMKYSYQQIAELTIDEAHAHFEKIKEKLREDMKLYLERLTAALVSMAQDAHQ